MAGISIIKFLTLPHKPLIRHITSHINGGNTTSRSLEWDYTDIRCIQSWDEFSFEALKTRFYVLFELKIPKLSLAEVVPNNYLDILSECDLEILLYLTTSVPSNYLDILSEYYLEVVLHMTRCTRVNIALQSVSALLSQTSYLCNTFPKDLERQVISPGLQFKASKPDLTFHLYSDRSQTCPIAIGDVKLYAKWSYECWKSSALDDRKDFRQVLAQVNYYMRLRRCRYAVVITELECIAIYRVPGYRGWLMLSEPFPIELTDSMRGDGDKIMTADVALFCLLLYAQLELNTKDTEEKEEEEEEEDEKYIGLDDYYPEELSSSPIPSSLPNKHPTSEYLPSSQ